MLLIVLIEYSSDDEVGCYIVEVDDASETDF